MTIRLAWRSIWRNKRRTLISTASVAIGLAIVIFFISMGDGVYYQLVDEAARMQAGHVTIEHPDYRDLASVGLWVDGTSGLRARLETLPEVKMTKLLVFGEGVARTGSDSTGAAVIGVEPSIERGTSPLADNIIKGEYLDDSDEGMAVIGSRMAKHLKLDIGKKLVVTANDADGVIVEQLFRVKGIFHTGADEVDGYLLQAPIGQVRSLFGMPDDSATQLGVIIKDITEQKKSYAAVGNELKEEKVAVLPWQRVMPELAAYIRVDKSSNVVFQGILMFLIMFTILNTVLMSVLERKREFAMLQAVGTEPRLLRVQVIFESMFIGVIGCGIGAALGLAVSYYYRVVGLDFSKSFGDETSVSGFAVSLVVHPLTTLPTMVWPTALVFAVTVLISLIAVRRISAAGIAETLRHNG